MGRIYSRFNHLAGFIHKELFRRNFTSVNVTSFNKPSNWTKYKNNKNPYLLQHILEKKLFQIAIFIMKVGVNIYYLWNSQTSTHYAHKFQIYFSKFSHESNLDDSRFTHHTLHLVKSSILAPILTLFVIQEWLSNHVYIYVTHAHT